MPNFVSVRQTVCLLEHRQTDTHMDTWTDGTNSITSTADMGGNEAEIIDTMYFGSYNHRHTGSPFSQISQRFEVI